MSARKPIKRSGLKSPTLEAIRAWEQKPRRAIPRGKRPARVGRRGKREHAAWELGRALVVERSGGFCEIPGGLCPNARLTKHSADHVHHLLSRGRGGKHHPSNLLHVCAEGHDWIHSHPMEAEHYGLLRRSEG